MRTAVHALHYLEMLRHELSCLTVHSQPAEPMTKLALTTLASIIEHADDDDTTSWHDLGDPAVRRSPYET